MVLSYLKKFKYNLVCVITHAYAKLVLLKALHQLVAMEMLRHCDGPQQAQLPAEEAFLVSMVTGKEFPC